MGIFERTFADVINMKRSIELWSFLILSTLGAMAGTLGCIINIIEQYMDPWVAYHELSISRSYARTLFEPAIYSIIGMIILSLFSRIANITIYLFIVISFFCNIFTVIFVIVTFRDGIHFGSRTTDIGINISKKLYYLDVTGQWLFWISIFLLAFALFPALRLKFPLRLRLEDQRSTPK